MVAVILGWWWCCQSLPVCESIEANESPLHTGVVEGSKAEGELEETKEPSHWRKGVSETIFVNLRLSLVSN
jgi:hypothetical protein